MQKVRGESVHVARWGVDEFLILIPRASSKATEELASRIRQECAASRPEPVALSIALGVATIKEESFNLDDVAKEAEDRMYRNKLMEGKSTRSALIRSLRETLAHKTHETEEHSSRIRDLACGLGQVLGLSPGHLDDLSLLTVLHYIGKIGIPDSILTKPSPLSAEGWDIMKRHPEIGCRIAKASYELSHIAECILCHHEK